MGGTGSPNPKAPTHLAEEGGMMSGLLGSRVAVCGGRVAAVSCGRLREFSSGRQHALAAPINTVVVLGSGLMGSGIAQVVWKIAASELV